MTALVLPQEPLLYTVRQATDVLEGAFGRRLPSRFVWRAVRNGLVTAKRPEGTRQFLLPRDQVAALADKLGDRKAILLPEYLTVKLLARLVGKTEKAVLHLINARQIPALRHPGGWFMIPIEPVQKFYNLTIPGELRIQADPQPSDQVMTWTEVLAKFGEEAEVDLDPELDDPGGAGGEDEDAEGAEDEAPSN